MNLKIGSYILTLIVGALIMFLLVRGCSDPEIIEVPVTIEVPVPVIVKEFDTVKEFVPIYREGPIKIDSTYYDKYIALSDSIQRDSLFKDAITIREYKERVEDDTIIINVYSKVQGFMKEQKVDYETKFRTIKLDTTIRVPIPKKPLLLVGPFLSMGTEQFNSGVSGGVKGLLVDKSHKRGYTLGYDFINKEITVGFLFKL
tara:strand:+ start:1244 stop:1846 length:603 start_codon:yes stop_codon:yes gene_type:complete